MWAITEGAYLLDGGTIRLRCVAQDGSQHEFELVQHRIPQRDGARLRGRIYWDGSLVPVQAGRERELLELLESAEIRPPDDLASEADHAEAPISGPDNRLVLGRDIEDHLEAMDDGPEAFIRKLVAGIREFVTSDDYGK